MIHELLISALLSSGATMPVEQKLDFTRSAATVHEVQDFENYLELAAMHDVSATRGPRVRKKELEGSEWIGDVIDALIDDIPEEAWENVPSDLAATIDKRLYGKD